MTEALAAAVAAYGLPSRRGVPDRPLDPHQWAAALREARDARTIGLLSRAIEEGSFAATDQQKAQAYDLHAESMGLAVVLERALLDVVALLIAATVDYRVLKGSAVAHLDYPDPALRPFGDVDLLVPASSFDLTVATLVEAGYARSRPQLRPGFDRRFAKSVNLTSPDGLPVDLHRTLAAGHFGLLLDVDDLFASSAPFVLAGCRLSALDAEDRFLHACYHAVLGAAPPLLALRDIAQMLLTTELDLGEVRQRCSAWRAEAVLARAVALAWETLGLSEPLPLVAWARGYRPVATERWALQAHSVQRRRGAKALTTLAAIAGLRNKLAFLWALAVPSPTFLGDGRGRYRRWWAQRAVALTRTGRRT